MQNYFFDYAQYKHKINKKSSNILPLLVFIIFILTGVLAFIRNTPNEQDFYFVQINEFASYKDAANLAQTLQQQNAAGYIYYDGTYHVFANFYFKEKDASSVVSNLSNEYPSAKIFTLTSPKKFNTKNISQQQKAEIDTFSLNVISLSQSINTSVTNLDTNKSNFAKIKLTLKSQISQFNKHCSAMLSTLSQEHNPQISYANNISSSLENLLTSTEQNASFKLKYHLTEIMINYSLFLSAF